MGHNLAVFKEIFVRNFSQYNTRSKSKIISKQCSNTFSQQLSFCGPANWAKVPVLLQDTVKRTQAFSSKLCKFLNLLGAFTLASDVYVNKMN